jgi:hypothetical protein
MALTPHFYHETTRKIIVCFGTLFNNIEVHRKDNKVIKVPLTYASKEKFYLTLKQNYDLNKLANITLPRIGFIITDIAYDFERKQSSIGKFHANSIDDHVHKKMFLPVPYDIQIELSIYSRNMNDGLQIIEQIIPFFKPSFNITINELDEMGVLRDIPIILDSIDHDDTSEGDLSEGFRLLRWDLSFTVKANFYGPVKDQKVIKKVYIDYHTSKDGEYTEEINERYYGEVVPEGAYQEELWEYEEEIISSVDSNNIEILPVEDSIREKYVPGYLHFRDGTEASVISNRSSNSISDNTSDRTSNK